MATHMTRRVVYNTRPVRPVPFWEFALYNEDGSRERALNFSTVMQEGYLRGLVLDQTGLNIDDAERIEDEKLGK